MRLKLTYKAQSIGKPILSEIILKTKIPINKVEAKVGSTASSEMVIDVPASGPPLEEVVTQLREAGIEVVEQPQIIQVNFNKCNLCGACVSPCPVSAINQKQDWSIEIEEKKCVLCGICVNSCPTAAIQLVD